MTTTYEKRPFTREDLPGANELLADLNAEERLAWSDQTFGGGLWGLTSGGIDSPVLPDLVQKAKISVGFVHINTGVRHPETLPFLLKVADKSKITIHTFTSEWGELTDEQAQELFEQDEERYKEVTKREPLRRAIHELGVIALISGVRSDQTENRAGLDYISVGNDGEFRIHPILDWPKEKVDDYKKRESLPRHPKSDEFGSLGDRIHTTAGEDRTGRSLVECGIHCEIPRR